MSSLGYTWRQNFPRQMVEKYRIYWHAMHPVTFDVKKMYRSAFTNKEWKALNLLKDRRIDTIDSGDHFYYKDRENDIDMYIDTPKKYKGFPTVTVNALDLDDMMRQELVDWSAIFAHHDNIDSCIRTYLRELLKTDEGKKSMCGLNTYRQLHALWPELLPFMQSSYRDTIRGTKVKPKLPHHWNQTTVDHFMGKEHMDEINYALTVIPMLPDKIDKHYPHYS